MRAARNPMVFPLVAGAIGILLVLIFSWSHRQTNRLSEGKPAPPFQATTTDGKPVNFPADYKGKVVLLDFWATWCGPCRVELPNVIAAYQRYHDHGLEVLSVSLDRSEDEAEYKRFLQENHMVWPQIFDGKFWNADVAVQYGINSIPRPILVDGDTGVILAEGDDARGGYLAAAIEKGLADKVKK